MEHLNNIVNILKKDEYTQITIRIHDTSISIHSTIDIIPNTLWNILHISCIMFQSDIFICQRSIFIKRVYLYLLTDKSTKVLENTIGSRVIYGISIEGKLKQIYSTHFRYNSNLLFNIRNESLYPIKKSLRRRIPCKLNISECKQVGIFNNQFILVEENSNVFIIDQHGLHERILYERYRKNKQWTDEQAKDQACRKAIKFGDKISEDFIIYLLCAWQGCIHPFVCAHGRPIVIDGSSI